MLACIACSKHELEDGGSSRATGNNSNPASTKESVKSITSQIKDMVLRFSGGGSSRQYKGGSSSMLSSVPRSKSFHHQRPASFLDAEDAVAGACGGGGGGGGGHHQYYTSYMQAASSNSTPAWDFTNETGNGAKWFPGAAGMVAGEDDVFLEDEGAEPKEWMAQVEPGVHITFVSLPGGAGNDLKRIRFSREMFNKWQAQRWWGENFDRIMELYNVQRFNRQAFSTPARSDDGDQRETSYTRVAPTRESPVSKERHPRSAHAFAPAPSSATTYGRGTFLPPVPDPSEYMMPYSYLQLHPPVAPTVGFSGAKVSSEACSNIINMDASRTTTSSRDEAAASRSISNASDLEITEWVEQDEPGVFITLREQADGTRELRRVRFSRERFGEVRAKLWWEQNRERIQSQYL